MEEKFFFFYTLEAKCTLYVKNSLSVQHSNILDSEQYWNLALVSYLQIEERKNTYHEKLNLRADQVNYSYMG